MGEVRDYQRLEFLGDRVLGLAIADELYRLFPRESEGALSSRLNALVTGAVCAEIARELDLPPLVVAMMYFVSPDYVMTLVRTSSGNIVIAASGARITGYGAGGVTAITGTVTVPRDGRGEPSAVIGR